MGHKTEQFAVVNNLFQLIDLPTPIPNRTGDRAHILDLSHFTQIFLLFFPLGHRTIVLSQPQSTLPANLLRTPLGIIIQPNDNFPRLSGLLCVE